DSSRKTVNVDDTSLKAMVAIDGAGFDWSYMADDEVPTNMALRAFLDSEYLAAVAVSDVPGSRTHVYIPAHGGSEAHNELPDSILSNVPKPLEKHKPPSSQSIWSPNGLSYPP
nr:hypothetical protein [Tanacetum cinerariifolium]